jgi:myo-inositol-hexaphosphate 3-phosphohydrolase
MELKVGDTVYFMTSQTAYLVEHVSSQNERFVTFKPAGVNSYIDLYKLR